MTDKRKFVSTLQTKEDWKEFALSYFKENPNKKISIDEIFILHDVTDKRLVEAIEELEREGTLKCGRDEKGKKWYIYEV